MSIVIQKINIEYSSAIELAKVYYTFITNINKIKIRPKELDLLCFCAVHGTISTPKVREAFIEQYNTPKNSVYNIVSQLQKMKLMTKVNGKIKVNPVIQLDFTQSSFRIELALLNKGL